MPRKYVSATEWLRNTWRPVMGVLYFLVCFFDFIVFPALWPILQVVDIHFQILNNQELSDTLREVSPWEATSLQGGAMFHLSMGAILGVSAWSRGNEKLANKDRESNE